MDIFSTLRSKAALVFPGQGTQYVGMGKALSEVSPEARHVLEEADEILDYPLSKLCFEGPQELLDDTEYAQPAILAVSIACWEALVSRLELLGSYFKPAYVAGHSLGEYTALVASGVLDFPTALHLVRERGRLMKEESEPGGMAAVIGLDEEVLREVCLEARTAGIIDVANDNSPGQTVLSGEMQALQKAMELARARGAKLVQQLAISIASHSPLMARAAARFDEIVSQINFRSPEIPLISNITGRATFNIEDIRRELSDHLCKPVQWTRSVREMISGGVDTFVEIGPRQVLSGLIKRIDRNVRLITLSDQELARLISQEG